MAAPPGPPPGPIARAQALGAPAAAIRARRVGGALRVVSIPETCTFYSKFRSSYVPLYMQAKGSDREKDSLRETKIERVEELREVIWEQARAWAIAEGATSNLQIDIGNNVVHYTDGNGDDHTVGLPHLNPALQDLIRQVKDLSTDLWKLNNSDDYSNNHLGNLTSAPAFGIVSQTWMRHLLTAPQDYFTDEHFGALSLYLTNVRGLPQADVQAAFHNIIAAIRFREAYKVEVQNQINALEQQKAAPGFDARPKDERRDIESDIEELRKLDAMLQNVKFDALFGAVGIWGNTPEDADEQDQMVKAGEAADWMRHNLTESLHPGEDTRGRFQKFKDYMSGEKDEKSLLIGLRSFTTTYAAQTGDTLVTSMPQIAQRVNADGNREIAAPSIEHFIAQNTIHTAEQGAAYHADMRRLQTGTGLRFSPATQTALANATDQARGHAAVAKATATGIAAAPGTDWKAWKTAAVGANLIQK